MGGHGDTLVSGKDAKCHASETLEQALKPLMRKQVCRLSEILEYYCTRSTRKAYVSPMTPYIHTVSDTLRQALKPLMMRKRICRLSCVYMYICIHMYMYIYILIYICIYTHIYIYIHIFIYVYLYIYIYIYIFIYICLDLCVYIYTYIYIYCSSDTYIHTYIYIYIYVYVACFATGIRPPRRTEQRVDERELMYCRQVHGRRR